MKKSKALVLMSGGLDSMLAARVLTEQGLDVKGLTFISCFFDSAQAKKSAENIGIELLEYDFSQEHLEMLKKPKHGYGKNMNPCIDCHGLMTERAAELMEKGHFDFIATGEVLGQRPKSQNKKSLGLVEKYGSLEGRILRPLSAKLLPETEMEKSGLVDRSRLLSISGRNRAEQKRLAEKFGIKDYPSPAGGCILTNAEYSNKLKKMIEKWPECDIFDIKLLRAGRNIWFGDDLFIVGRHKEDNQKISDLAESGDTLFESVEKKGPLVLWRRKNGEKNILSGETEIDIPEKMNFSDDQKEDEQLSELGSQMSGYFSNKLRGRKIKIKIK